MKQNEVSLKKSRSIDVQVEDRLRDELRTNNLATRMKLVIYAKTDEKRRFPKLEGLTGIPVTTWRSWWRSGVSPSGALVEAIARQWPEHAYWLITGMTDMRCGHTMPALHEYAQNYIANWPEREEDESEHMKQSYGKTYLRYCIDLANIDEKEPRHDAGVMLHALPYLTERRFDEINQNFADKSAPTWLGTIRKADE